MDSGDLKQIAVDHGDLIEDPLPDEIFFAGFGFRAEREFNNDSSPGPCPPQMYSDEANSTMITLLNRPDTVHPFYGEDPPVDDLDMLGEEDPVERLAEIATD